MTQSTTPKGSRLDQEKTLLCELLAQFYQLGWCTGTGGGISSKVGSGYLMAPSGVAKERVQAEQFFELNEQFEVTNLESLSHKKISECMPLFQAIYKKTGAGAVIHTHSINLVVAMNQERNIPFLTWTRLEMIKGIKGAAYRDTHRVQVIENTPRECELTSALTMMLESLPPNAHGVFVRDHGAYIWGQTVMEAKRHAEVYDWLCQYTLKSAR
jgi:methylthioribulose-1-phosphate dehydratase